MIKKNYQSEYEKLAKENQAFLKYQYQDLILFFLKKIRDFPDLPQKCTLKYEKPEADNLLSKAI